MSKKKVLLRGVFINRDTNGEGVLKVGTTLIRVSTVMGILYTSIYNDELARLKEEYGEKAKGNVSYSKIKVDISAERSKEKNNNEGNTIDLQI